jgi:hypothetical protein
MNTDAGQVTDGDITIDSNHETAEQIQTAFADDPPPVERLRLRMPLRDTAPVDEPDVCACQSQASE